MHDGANRKASIDSNSTQDPQPLDSGLYCDFARRSSVESLESNREASKNNTNNSSEEQKSGDQHKGETGIRKFGLFQKFASLREELSESGLSWGKSSSNMSSHHSNNSGQPKPMETEGTGAVTMKMKGSKPRGPRRGSHCMMPPAGGKMPTSAELMAMKQQQPAPVAAAPPADTSAGATSAKPRRRRGSHFMPEGGGKMPTSAELMAQKQQANMAQMPQDTSSPAPTMKMKGNGPRRGSHMMPDTQGQLQNLSVKCASPTGQPVPPTDGSDEYGEGSPATSGSRRGGARRRGSVVRTLMQDKNVDGDGHNPSGSNDRVSNDFDSSVRMEDADSGSVQVLPQRRSSQDNDASNGPKRVMLKQEHSDSATSDDFGKETQSI